LKGPNVSVLPPGQRTSSASACAAPPRPTCRRGSFDEQKLWPGLQQQAARLAAERRLRFGADREDALFVDETEADERAAARRHVPQHVDGRVRVHHDRVDPAVVVEVAERRAARPVDQRRRGPAARRDLDELRSVDAAEELVQLAVGLVLRGRIAAGAHDAAVRDVEVGAAVVVEVGEPAAEARERTARRAEAELYDAVVEPTAFAVEDVERVGLVAQVGDEDIPEAVLVDVGREDAHARLRDALRSEGAAHGERFVLEDETALVDPELVLVAVVRDVGVDAAVAVEVGRDDAEAVAVGRFEPGFARDVAELAAALVAIDRVDRRRLVVVRPAVVGVVCRRPCTRSRDAAPS
jgi:hypothetical protein